VYAAVINGVIAVPILVAVMKIANDKQVLKDKVNGHLSNIIGWLTVMIMGISVLIMFLTFVYR
jgi:Mn2+/Fe2+ NRAMP family transporter